MNLSCKLSFFLSNNVFFNVSVNCHISHLNNLKVFAGLCKMQVKDPVNDTTTICSAVGQIMKSAYRIFPFIFISSHTVQCKNKYKYKSE